MTTGSVPLKPVPTVYVWLMVAMFAIAVVVLFFAWDRIPDPMPVHWGITGEADGFRAKSVGNVIFFLGLGGGILAVAGLIAMYSIRHRAATAHEGLPKKSEDEVNRQRAEANLMVPVVGTFMVVMTAIVVWSMVNSLITGNTHGWLLVVLILVAVVWFMRALGTVQKTVDQEYGTTAYSEHLKWGMFYHNPDTDRILIDHSGGIAFNFAKPAAWAFLLILLIPAVIVLGALILFT